MSDDNNNNDDNGNEENGKGGRDWSKWKETGKKAADYAKKNPGQAAAAGIGLVVGWKAALIAGAAGYIADSPKGRKAIDDFKKAASDKFGVDLGDTENKKDQEAPEAPEAEKPAPKKRGGGKGGPQGPANN